MSTDAVGMMVVMVIFVFFFIGVLLFAIPALITNWQLFTKAGKPGWASIIPVYNTVVMAQIGKKPEWMGWVAGFASIFSGILAGIGEAANDTYITLAFSSLSFMIIIGALVLTILILVGFIKQYRHAAGASTVGFWVCYFLVPIAAVFMVKNIVHKGAAADYTPAAPQIPGQQPVPPYVPPVA